MTAPILVTGFLPFTGHERNPAGEVAEALDGAQIGSRRVHGRVVPVSWVRAWPTIAAAVATTRPAALVMLGVADRPDRPGLQLEAVGRNRVGVRADVDGALPDAARVAPDAPDLLRTTLPVESLLGEAAGLPVTLSEDAGDYLCNLVLFQALRLLEFAVPVVGFVHLPPLPGPARPHGHPLAAQVAAVRSLLERCY